VLLSLASRRRTGEWHRRAPPLRFSAPSAVIVRRIGCRPVPPGHLPSSTFRRSLRASSSPSVASLFHPAAAHGVRPLQSFSLPTNSPRLVTWRSPLGVLSNDQWSKVAPSGVCVNRQSVSRLRSIASFVRPMLSWVFQSLPRRSCAPVWIRLATSHPLLAFASNPYGTCSKSAFSVFLPGAPGISRSLERQPS
jgi:hypothetical protein